MRITFVLPGGGGGGPRSIARFAGGLAQLGHDVCILYRKTSRIRDRLQLLYLDIAYGGRERGLRDCPVAMRGYSTLTPQLAGRNDILVGVGIEAVLAISEMPACCGVRVNNCHGAEPHIRERMLHSWALPMPRIVSSSCVMHQMRQEGCRDDIFVVHNGVDASDYYPCTPEVQRRGVGAVYHGAQVKDPSTVLATLNRVHERSPDTPLYVFGAFPRPRDLPRAARYVRLPTLEQARDLYSRSLVWFCGSRSEGFSMPLLEAMSCSCAIVSTDCGGPSDFIRSEENGFLVPVGDIHGLTERILQLLEDPSLRDRFRMRNTQMLPAFSWHKMVLAYEAALLSILGKASVVPVAGA